VGAIGGSVSSTLQTLVQRVADFGSGTRCIALWCDLVSLLNEMLRNLDSRRQSADPEGGIQLDAQPAVRKNRPVSLLIGLIFIAGLSAAFILGRNQLLDQTASPVSSVPELLEEATVVSDSTSAPVPRVDAARAISKDSIAEVSPDENLLKLADDATPQLAEQTRQSVSQSQAETISAPQVISTPVPEISLRPPSAAFVADPSDIDREIQQLLHDAGLAVVRERLTTPPGDNALQRYRRVLALVPNHPEALAGIDEIVSVYLILARDYLDSGNIEHARSLVQRAQGVKGMSTEIAVMKGLLATESTHDTAAVSDDLYAHADRDPTKTNVRQNSAASKTEQIFLKGVEELVRANAESEARSRLEQFLVTHPDSVATIEELFRLYLRSDDPEMAQKLLDRSSQLPRLTALELGAQLEVQRGNLIDAVEMLETVAPGYEETSYHALLAGLYQKLGRFSEAAGNYRQLLYIDPDQGIYWLGLAVSLDSLQQYQDALSAFQRALDSGQYEGDVRQYIEQRISALSR